MPNKTNDIFRKAYEKMCAYLDAHHMNHTTERYTILQTVCNLQTFSVEELRNALVEINISRATIYNNLNMLEQAGVLRRLDKEVGVRAGQYELIHPQSSSIKVICQRCGRISDVKDTTINRMLADKKFTNFVPEYFTLYIHGHCKVCRRQKRKP